MVSKITCLALAAGLTTAIDALGEGVERKARGFGAQLQKRAADVNGVRPEMDGGAQRLG